MVKERTENGWEFAFLGAGIDAYVTAGTLGFEVANTMSYSRGSSRQTFTSLNAATMRAAGGQAMGFTAVEKRASGDTWGKPKPAARPTPPPTPRPLVEDIRLDP
jgi:hypothetical protein